MLAFEVAVSPVGVVHSSEYSTLFSIVSRFVASFPVANSSPSFITLHDDGFILTLVHETMTNPARAFFGCTTIVEAERPVFPSSLPEPLLPPLPSDDPEPPVETPSGEEPAPICELTGVAPYPEEAP